MTTPSDFEFAKIYTTHPDPEVLADQLAVQLRVVAVNRVLTLPGLTVETLRNDDHRPGSPDFLHWPTLVEIEAADDAGLRAMRDVVAQLLQFLWDEARAVASCRFEDELPYAGGIGRH